MPAEDYKIICPVCGYENNNQAKVCARCSNVLQTATKQIDMPTEMESKQRLGKSEVRKKLYLHLRELNEMLSVSIDEDREIVLGRSDPATNHKPDVDLAPYDAVDKGVSRSHAMIKVDNGTLRLLDLDSSNHTYLNGQQLIPRQRRILRDGDEIRLGHFLMVAQFGEENGG
jgi:pSer/pThr/pTyr-binding forkhead associated (FHA) protein